MDLVIGLLLLAAALAFGVATVLAVSRRNWWGWIAGGLLLLTVIQLLARVPTIGGPHP